MLKVGSSRPFYLVKKWLFKGLKGFIKPEIFTAVSEKCKKSFKK